MAKDYPRALRVGEQIRRELSSLLRSQVKDPRINDVCINEVVVTRDLSSAKVFYSIHSDSDSDSSEVQRGLTSAAPYLRKLLGSELRLRAIPNLKFIVDDSQIKTARLEDILRENLSAEDASEIDDSTEK